MLNSIGPSESKLAILRMKCGFYWDWSAGFVSRFIVNHCHQVSEHIINTEPGENAVFILTCFKYRLVTGIWIQTTLAAPMVNHWHTFSFVRCATDRLNRLLTMTANQRPTRVKVTYSSHTHSPFMNLKVQLQLSTSLSLSLSLFFY